MQPLIVANWKMNPQTLKGAKLLFDAVQRGLKNIKKANVVICPPFIYLPALASKSYPQNLSLGAQNAFWEQSGAFTGEISAIMLKSLRCQYVILGHSERRKYFGETDKLINKKIKIVLSEGLKPILCIANLSQLKNSLAGISQKIIIAYEPLSAIGSGKPEDPVKAKKMRRSIKYPFVLYGGSVNSKNALDYIKKAGFQGLLVGSASLRAEEFIQVIKNIDNEN